VGIGLSSYLGGAVVDGWSAAYPVGQEPLGLRGWQVAFLVAGLPGLLLVPLVLSFREPVRGAQEESSSPLREPPREDGERLNPLKAALLEGLALLPPFSFVFLKRDRVPMRRNAWVFTALATAATLVWSQFGDLAQWVCVAVGLYVVSTMAERLKVLEPDAFALIFKTPSLRLATLGFSFLSFTGYVISFWTAQFFIRYHGYSVSEIGDRLGVISVLGGGLGVTAGGILADWFRRRRASGSGGPGRVRPLP